MIPVTIKAVHPGARRYADRNRELGADHYPVDLRPRVVQTDAHPAEQGRDYLPGTYVERWYA